MRSKFWHAVTRTLADTDADTDRVMSLLAGVQQVRVWMEELQSAVLHLSALPTRQDVRSLHRRVVSLRKRVGELDEAMAMLEARLESSRASGPD